VTTLHVDGIVLGIKEIHRRRRATVSRELPWWLANHVQRHVHPEPDGARRLDEPTLRQQVEDPIPAFSHFE
jgi:hypothetical protein